MGSVADRLAHLERSVRALADRPYPTWVGGRARSVGAVAAAHARGWNRWGLGADEFAAEADTVRTLRTQSGTTDPFTISWGGLVVLGDDDADAQARAERLGAGSSTLVGGPATMASALERFAAAGAEWVILGPIDASDAANAERIGAELVPRVRDVAVGPLSPTR